MTYSLQDQAAERDRMLLARLDTVIPGAMDRHDIDAWVVSGREYGEGPVLTSMLPSTWLSARRRTILVFTERGKRRGAVARYDAGEGFPSIWNPSIEPNQWKALADHLSAADPSRIAIDVSQDLPFADGMTAAEREALMEALPDHLSGRIVPSRELAIEWLESRIGDEMSTYAAACDLGHELLAEALSPATIRPGVTSTSDVEWWLREQAATRHVGCWFHPTVSVQRPEGPSRNDFSSPPGDTTILKGDLVHIDFGVVLAGLHTDQQQHAYVLKTGESAPPQGLVAGLAAANRAQDALLGELRAGRSGNEVLAATTEKCRDLGLAATIYTHPIGLHGHGAGPTIGLWDQQDGVPGTGELLVRPNTAWSIELSVEEPVAEWDDQVVRFMLEEEAFLTTEGCDWLSGRQTELHVIG